MTTSERDWTAYYDRTAGRPPRRTLLFALDRFGQGAGRAAVDLGCGEGRDAIELLRRGWHVLAIDAEPAALTRLRQREDLPAPERLETRCERFEDAHWPPVELVNASFSLPLCPPPRFAEVWSRIERSLPSGGRFAGQLLGPRDSWHGTPGITFHARSAVEGLLARFAVEFLEEEESDTVTPGGKAKHWHLFHIVARQKG